ncbi:MAG TPA: amidophosphoribosyltransferase [Candidatus Nanoarchaeia archaeon]
MQEKKGTLTSEQGRCKRPFCILGREAVSKKEGELPFGESLGHACGLYTVFAPNAPVAWLTARALDGQQTRGQEGAGIATTDGEDLHLKKGRGLVTQVFPTQRLVRKLTGFAAIGHTRYSTTGRDKVCNVQPLKVAGPNGEICLGHNGNLVNARGLRRELEANGEAFETTTDSEIIAKLVTRAPGRTWVDKLRYVMPLLRGSYCVSILTKDSVLMARDPTGNRPLCIGKTNSYWAAASESGVFNNQPVEFFREVEPGEIVVFDEDGMTSHQGMIPTSLGICVFELIYFMRPDSILQGVEAYGVRYRAGQTLARSNPTPADLVIGVPRSGFYAADGYTAESGIPVAHGIVANLLFRVFLNPNQAERKIRNELKYSTTSIISGKRLIVIDDSIVRGNSNNRVIQILKMAGAAEVHIRSTFPPIIKPCYLGIDMATKKELIAARFGGVTEEVEEKLARHWDVASVRYLSVPELVEAIGLPMNMICLRCVGGRSAVELPTSFRKEEFEEVGAVA